MAAAIRDLGIRPSSQLAVDVDAPALRAYTRNLHPLRTLCKSVTDLVEFEVHRNNDSWSFSSHPRPLAAATSLEAQIDIVIGGPPCQGHSNLNNATRKTDARNGLYFGAVALAVALKPHAIIFENVPEVRIARSRVINASTALLKSLGYNVEEFMLTATEFGWPQTRRRHFLVASLSRIESEIDLRRFYGGAHPSSSSFLSLITPREKPALMNAIPDYNDETKMRLDFYANNEGVFDLPLSLRPQCQRSGTTYESVYGRIRPDGPFPTITTGFLTAGRGRFIHPCELRTLTPSEASFVQGFPIWYDFGDDLDLTKSMLTKWIGDAVPLPLGYVAAMAVLPSMVGISLEEAASLRPAK